MGKVLRKRECEDCHREFYESPYRSPFRVKRCPYCDSSKVPITRDNYQVIYREE